MSSDTIIGQGATLIFKLLKMKLFSAFQSSVVVVVIEAVLTSNQSPVMTSEDFSDVYSGLQALCVTVFQTSVDVDLLCKKSYKSSSVLGSFDGFQLNHTVGCCNINFSGLSQIRREKSCKQCLYNFVALFVRLQVFRCHVWPTFHSATP